jgi:biopolymer transport protein ExbD
MAAFTHELPDQPIMELNTTPLIDVLLVLLVMFIITIPIQTHAVKLDLPAEGAPPPIEPVRNTVVITAAGTILWNGAQIGEPALRYNLARSQQVRPTPELHLRPDADARYEAVDRVLGLAKQENVTKMGFTGNERFQSF